MFSNHLVWCIRCCVAIVEKILTFPYLRNMENLPRDTYRQTNKFLYFKAQFKLA